MALFLPSSPPCLSSSFPPLLASRPLPRGNHFRARYATCSSSCCCCCCYRKDQGVADLSKARHDDGGSQDRRRRLVHETSTADDDVHQAGVVDTSNASLVCALKACAKQNVAAFHFPGHSRGAAAPFLLSSLLGKTLFAHDLPELPELAAPEVIANSQAEAATLFGADITHFLVNGSTCGIQAAVLATCSPGDVLILPRNSHISAISALVLSGSLPKFLIPSYDPHWDIAHGVDPQEVNMAIREVRKDGKRKIGAVLITSPTYFGVCSDVREIAKICQKNGVPLIVDEAHGAHFCFHPDFPDCALEQGADMAVQSTHKVLTSLTQTAMLHVKGSKVNRELLTRCLQLLQTTSPSYLLLASLDAACAQLNSANAPFHEALQLSLAARKSLKQIAGLEVLDIGGGNAAAVALDPLRITIGLWRLGISGFEADEVLRTKHLVVAEMPSLHSITFAINLGTSSKDVQHLIKAFRSLSNDHHLMHISSQKISSSVVFPDAILRQSVALSPREAFFASTKRIGTKDAEGHVCAELICPYPPGIPLLIPGEVISREVLRYLADIIEKGGTVAGASDVSLGSLLICI